VEWKRENAKWDNWEYDYGVGNELFMIMEMS
jgi:hypothetical protein